MMYVSWCSADQKIYIYIPENITEVSSVFTSYFTCTDEMPNLTFSMYKLYLSINIYKNYLAFQTENNSGKQIN